MGSGWGGGYPSFIWRLQSSQKLKKIIKLNVRIKLFVRFPNQNYFSIIYFDISQGFWECYSPAALTEELSLEDTFFEDI
jgi:hypothetical protein